MDIFSLGKFILMISKFSENCRRYEGKNTGYNKVTEL